MYVQFFYTFCDVFVLLYSTVGWDIKVSEMK